MLKFHMPLTFALALFSLSAHAISPTAEAEIEKLIASVATSGCTFIRNGDEHEAKAAAEHLRKKYDYLKDDLESAEAFIEQAASRSSVTKTPYAIRCPQQAEVMSEQWFTAKLKTLRTNKP